MRKWFATRFTVVQFSWWRWKWSEKLATTHYILCQNAETVLGFIMSHFTDSFMICHKKHIFGLEFLRFLLEKMIFHKCHKLFLVGLLARCQEVNASSNQATFCSSIQDFQKDFQKIFSARWWILDFYFQGLFRISIFRVCTFAVSTQLILIQETLVENPNTEIISHKNVFDLALSI